MTMASLAPTSVGYGVRISYFDEVMHAYIDLQVLADTTMAADNV